MNAQVIDRDGSDWVVNAGGITGDRAADVIAALDDGQELPFGFVQISPDELAAVANERTTEFGGPDGLTITVEVGPGGRATYVQQASVSATRADTERPGVDESVVRVIGDDVSVMARTGMDEFIRLVADVDTVILVTTVVGNGFTESNNDVMFDASEVAGNIRIFEWDRFADPARATASLRTGCAWRPTGPTGVG